MNYCFTLVALFLSLQASAQLSVGSEPMTVLTGTTLSVDGLVLTPSTNLTLINNTLQKSTSPISTTPHASISQVHQFSVSIPFSGTVGLNYSGSDLNGNTEAKLKLAYSSASAGPFKVNTGSRIDTPTKFIQAALSNQTLVGLTAVTQNPDLTPTLLLPQANFAATGAEATRNFTINLFEIGGEPIPNGTVVITLTAPIGYTLAYTNSLSSINVSGGDANPVRVDNPNWTVSTNLQNRQLTLTINSNQGLVANGSSVLGFSITRTTANSGSTSNITINVKEDGSGIYDGNASNNIYARIISGL